jgi:transcriptional regulator with XRE-family HTH domain
MDHEKLGARIREERLRLRLTQAALAEAIDISNTYMGAIERGTRGLTLGTLVRLVNRLGVTIDYMLADSVPDNDSNIVERFKQMIDGQPLERKEMVLDISHMIISYLEKEDQS